MPTENVSFYVPWVTEQDRKAVCDALKSPWLTGGPRVARFEAEFAEYVGVKHAVAVNCCTAALHLAMRALGIGPGDEVILPTFTFAATANAVLYCGAKPILADIDPSTLDISSTEITRRISNRTKGVIVVHYAGQPCDMRDILKIANDHGLFVVEDCAHSLGATYMGKRTGSIGLAGCFSFYPTKNITAIEGGMLTTNDDSVARKVRLLREHGMTKSAIERDRDAGWFYDVVELGYNYRMNDIQAALGLSQLRRVDRANARRVSVAQCYGRHLAGLPGVVTPSKRGDHVFHLYVTRVVSSEYGLTRNELFQHLRTRGISTSVHYTPLHLLKYYRETLGYKLRDFPVAERAYEEVLSLPLFPTMTKSQIQYVCKEIRKAPSARKPTRDFQGTRPHRKRMRS